MNIENTLPTSPEERITYITAFGYQLQRLEEDIERLEKMEMPKGLDFMGRNSMEHLSRAVHDWGLIEYLQTVHLLCIATLRAKAKELKEQLLKEVKP